MTPIIPLEYSRKAVGRAGTTLQREQYLTEKYSQSLDVLSNWRASHIYPLSKIQNLLYKRAQKIDKKALIAQRLKRTPSIINKLHLLLELAYLKLERESTNPNTDNIVLVKTESAYNLKKTYPNYFTDSHFFIKQLKILLA